MVRRELVLLLLLLLSGAAYAEEVQGDWVTEADRALAVARKEGKPVLAVAMDHG